MSDRKTRQTANSIPSPRRNGEVNRISSELTAIARLHRPIFRRSVVVLFPLALTISVAAAMTRYFPFDPWVTRQAQQITAPAFRLLMIAISWPGYGYHPLVIVPGIAMLLLMWRRTAEAGCLLVSAVGAALLGHLIKTAIARPRPVAALADIYLQHSTMSFPSGHVLGYVASYGFLLYVVFVTFPHSWARRALLALLGILVGLVGVSRVYLGAHWASDVIGGYALGLVWLGMMVELYWEMKLR